MSTHLSYLDKRIEYFDQLFQHLERWGFRDDDLGILVGNPFKSLHHLLHESWEAGVIVEEHEIDGKVLQTRSLSKAEQIADAAILAHQQIKLSVAKLRIHLQLAESIALDAGPIGYPKAHDLSKYNLASDCVDDLRRDLTDRSSRLEQVGDRELSDDLLRQESGLVLVVGTAGYGKTTFCRWNALNDLEAWKKGESQAIPIYVRLAMAQLERIQSPESLVRIGAQTALLSDDEKSLVASEKHKLRVYLDGLDEVASHEDRVHIVELARNIATQRPDWQIIITSRDYYREPWISCIPRLELSGLDLAALAELAKGLLGQESALPMRFITQVSESFALRELARIPLLATLMIWVFKCTNDLPAQRAALFTTFIDLLCGGWDVVKNVNRLTRFGKDVKLAILTRLASTAHRLHRKSVTTEQLYSLCVEALPGVFYGVANSNRFALVQELIGELLADCLLKKEGDDVHFAHMSFQEFLVAKSFANDPDRNSLETVIREYLEGDDWWREVAVFALALTSDPQKTVEWMKHTFGHMSHVNQKRHSDLMNQLRLFFPTIVAI